LRASTGLAGEHGRQLTVKELADAVGAGEEDVLERSRH
jgi:hypothetical protein